MSENDQVLRGLPMRSRAHLLLGARGDELVAGLSRLLDHFGAAFQRLSGWTLKWGPGTVLWSTTRNEVATSELPSAGHVAALAGAVGEIPSTWRLTAQLTRALAAGVMQLETLPDPASPSPAEGAAIDAIWLQALAAAGGALPVRLLVSSQIGVGLSPGLFRGRDQLVRVQFGVRVSHGAQGVDGAMQVVLPMTQTPSWLEQTRPGLETLTRIAAQSPWTVTFGAQPVTLGALQSLAPHDLVLSAANTDAVVEGLLVSGDICVPLALRVGAEGWTAWIADTVVPPHEVEMSVATDAMTEALAQAPIEVSFRLASVQLTAEMLAGLSRGDHVDLGVGLSAPVDIVVAGRVVGSGDLIDLEGTLGIRVRELHT